MLTTAITFYWQDYYDKSLGNLNFLILFVTHIIAVNKEIQFSNEGIQPAELHYNSMKAIVTLCY